MKIDEALVQQGFKDGTIQYEAHERVPLFIVEPESMLVDGEETYLITDTFKTYEVGGVLYAKMDSTHKNPDGTFSGAEPTYSNDMSKARQALWAEQYELVTSETFEELRRVSNMEPEEYREYHREQLEIASKPGHFAFECELSGQVLSYDIEDSDRIDVIGQLVMGATEVEIHDVKRIKDICTAEEASVIMGKLAEVTRTHKYPFDAKIKALYELADEFTNEDVDVIVNG